MELNKNTQQNPVLKALVEVSFLLTVVIGISFSMELLYRLLTKKLFRNKLIFRYLLFFKLVSDVLGLVSALASFSLERSLESSLDLLVLFYPCAEVFSHLMVGAGSISSLLTFIYCSLKILDFAKEKDEGITSSDICSTITAVVPVIVFVVMINILVLNKVSRLFPAQEFFPLRLFSSVLFWMDSILLVFFIVAFIIFVASKLKTKLHHFRNIDNNITTTTAVQMHEGNVTTVLITDYNDEITITGKTGKNAKSSSKTYNNTDLDPGSSKMKLFLFLLWVILLSLVFNCVFLIQEINNFSYYEAVIYSFFSAFSLIIMRMNN